MRTIVPVAGLASVIDRYDGLIIDFNCIVTGDGRLHPGALEALERLKASGTRVVITACASGGDGEHVAALDKLGVDDTLYERLISTGQLMRQALVAQALGGGEKKRYFVAGTDAEKAGFGQGKLALVDSVAEADAVVLLSLDQAGLDVPGGIEWLGAAAQRGLPLYAAKADVSTLTERSETTPGFAAVLGHYRLLGGQIMLFGKPSGRLYARCLNLLDPIENERIASIGDQFPADIVGARSMGIEPIFVGSGAGGLAEGGLAAWETELERLGALQGVFELTVMPGLIWGPAQ